MIIKTSSTTGLKIEKVPYFDPFVSEGKSWWKVDVFPI